MVRFLRGLRWVTRLCILGILIWTAVAALRYAPLPPKPLEQGAMAPPRQSTEGLIESINRIASGGPASVSLFNVDLIDPALGIMSAVSTPECLGSVALAMLIPVLLTLCMGRVFCGYFCPVGWMATLAFRLRRIIGKAVPLPDLSVDQSAGYLLLAVIVCFAVAGWPSAFSLALVHLQLQRLATHAAQPEAVWTAVGAVSAFVAFAFLISPGGWCRSLCPSGTVYALIGKNRLLRLVKSKGRRCPTGCDRCREHCWLQLSPKGGDPGPFCDACMTCASACPQKLLNISRAPKRSSSPLLSGFFFLGLIVIASVACSENTLGMGEHGSLKLDANPPWSVHINQLDREDWAVRDDLRAGLSVSFVERSLSGDLYIFAATIVDEGHKRLDYGPVDFRLASGERSAILRMDGPNAPRSTPKRIVYSGRAFVDPSACNELEASFLSTDMSLGIVFPESCRAERPARFLSGFLFWGGFLVVLVLLGLLVRRGVSRVGGQG